MKKLLACLICLSLIFPACSPGKSSEFTTRTTEEPEKVGKEVPKEREEERESPTSPSTFCDKHNLSQN